MVSFYRIDETMHCIEVHVLAAGQTCTVQRPKDGPKPVGCNGLLWRRVFGASAVTFLMTYLCGVNSVVALHYFLRSQVVLFSLHASAALCLAIVVLT